jgi:histidinol-phosphatase (PHP family)
VRPRAEGVAGTPPPTSVSTGNDIGEGAGSTGAGEIGATGAAAIDQATDVPLDAHLHTDRSSDSDVPIDAYAAQAADRRIAAIAITDHVEFDPRWPNVAPDFAERERTVREAAERWGDRGVAIRFGIEVSYESVREAGIRDHLATHPYDFAIGSVHVGPDSPYHESRVRSWVAGRGLADIVAPYFAEVEAAARSGLFDAIGHLDFVKRYLLPCVTPADLAAAPELYVPVLRALVESGTALEVNTSGLRQGPAETYPAPAIVALFRELGGERVTAGSDAHRRDAFAFGLEEGYRAVSEAGFDALAPGRGAIRGAVDLPARFLERRRSSARSPVALPARSPGLPNAGARGSL